jgi:hypothetical protein
LRDHTAAADAWSGTSGTTVEQFGIGNNITAKLRYPQGQCASKPYEIKLEFLDEETGTEIHAERTIEIVLDGPPR